MTIAPPTRFARAIAVRHVHALAIIGRDLREEIAQAAEFFEIRPGEIVGRADANPCSRS